MSLNRFLFCFRLRIIGGLIVERGVQEKRLLEFKIEYFKTRSRNRNRNGRNRKIDRKVESEKTTKSKAKVLRNEWNRIYKFYGKKDRKYSKFGKSWKSEIQEMSTQIQKVVKDGATDGSKDSFGSGTESSQEFGFYK